MSDKALIQITAAAKALERAKSIPEVKTIRDQAQTISAYMKRQKYSLQAQNDAAELKIRAERKLGQLIPEQFPRGGDRKTGSKSHDATLIDAGITKSSSSRWQLVAEVPEKEFEAVLTGRKQTGEIITTGEIVRQAKRDRSRREVDRRIKTPKAETAPAGPFEIILADPPWRYDDATPNREVENHYPTATTGDIGKHILKVPIAKKAVLFLWATAPKLLEALNVLEIWGFTYRTHAIWDKEKIGMGHWFRGQHELLLVGTKGGFSSPPDQLLTSSIFRERRTGHSRKPECVYAWIERAFVGSKFLEMYCRKPRPGWIAWGNEV